MNNRILVTGNLGYIGSVLTEFLKKYNYEITGLDIGFFKDCLLERVKYLKKQINKDIKLVNRDDLKKIDMVVHLAAISNDPLGELNPRITNEINYLSTIKFAKLAKKCGVKKFIYISSQSMYGISNTATELDEYNSKKNPITEYAKTKWKAEKEILKLNSKNFITVSLRPSTVFGSSPRLRCDIVFNNMLACAYTTKKIEVKSDGSPWRPAVHVQDVCQAVVAVLKAPAKKVSGQSYNVGIKNGNYSVKELAYAVKDLVPNCKIVFTNEHTDNRTYKVSFNKILTELNKFYNPKWTLHKGGEDLIKFFKKNNFTENDFRGSITNRLLKINEILNYSKQLS